MNPTMSNLSGSNYCAASISRKWNPVQNDIQNLHSRKMASGAQVTDPWVNMIACDDIVAS